MGVREGSCKNLSPCAAMHMTSILLEGTHIPANLLGITLLKDAHRAKTGLEVQFAVRMHLHQSVLHRVMLKSLSDKGLKAFFKNS